MGSAPAGTIDNQRAATAECANAQTRKRGLRHALTRNMVCTRRLTAA